MSARCTMSFDAPIFYVDSSDLHLIDLEKVRSARVYECPDARDLFSSIVIAFCNKDGFYLWGNDAVGVPVTGELVTDDRPLKSFDASILRLAHSHNVLLDDVKVEKDPKETDYWKVTVGSLLVSNPE